MAKKMDGKKTYTGIATFVVGAALSKWAPHLSGDAASLVTPELVAFVADGLMAGGAMLATVGRALTTPKPRDEQDRITPRPQ